MGGVPGSVSKSSLRWAEKVKAELTIKNTKAKQMNTTLPHTHTYIKWSAKCDIHGH